METLFQDLEFGGKLLLKERAYSATILLTLAICIGANVTIFSVINNVMLEPLPFAQPDRLVRVYNAYPGAGVERAGAAAADYFFRRERVEAFGEVAVYQGAGYTIGEPGRTERVQAIRVTPSLFRVLRVQPQLGRLFAEDEIEPGNELKVVLTHGFWQERYGGDAAALGADLRVDGRPYTIIGVLPAAFDFVGEDERRFYVPIAFTPEQRTVEDLHNNNFQMIARLRPGATIEQAVSQIATLNNVLVDEMSLPNARQLAEDVGYHAVVRDLRADLLRDIKPTLVLLWGGVAFVLLIGCLNIANLMLARAHARVRELATRIAVGADRLRLARQLLTEALLTSVLGGALGLGFGWGGLALIGGLGVDQLPRGAQVAVDSDVVIFTVLIAIGSGLFFGAIPLASIFHSDLGSVFRAESRTGTATRHAALLRAALTTGQIAFAFVLLIGAALMFASLRAALDVNPGFEPESVLTGLVALPASSYPDGDSRRLFSDRLLRELRALPGVRAASVTNILPFGGVDNSSVIVPEGYELSPGESLLAPHAVIVGPQYFETLGIPLITGRLFDESDDAGTQRVIILDEWLAQRYFPNENPLGRRMVRNVPGAEVDEDDLYTIVGVVGQIKHNDLTESEHVGAYYFTYKQLPISVPAIVARTDVVPLSLTGAVRQAVSRIDPDLPFYGTQTLEQRVAESLVVRRTPMLLLVVFAGVALFLAVVGIYGMLAYSVSQRTRELGIRMALGGTPPEVFRHVLWQGVRVIGLGLTMGLVASLLLSRLIEALLYGVQPTNPFVLATVALLLVITAVIACVLPARRATRIDPVLALSIE